MAKKSSKAGKVSKPKKSAAKGKTSKSMKDDDLAGVSGGALDACAPVNISQIKATPVAPVINPGATRGWR